MTTEGDACTMLRLTLTVDGRGVEIVHAMRYRIVCLLVDHLLVVVVLVFRL